MRVKNIILGSVLALIGALMLLFPQTCLKAVVLVAGLATAASGIYNLCTIYKTIENPGIKKTFLIKSIVSITVGVIAVACPLAFIKTADVLWDVFSFILSVYLIAYAVTGFVTISKLKSEGILETKKLMSEALLCLLIAILLFIIPFESIRNVLIRIIGAGGLLIGVILIIVEIAVSKRTLVVKDAVVVDEPEVTAEEVKEEISEEQKDNSGVEK